MEILDNINHLFGDDLKQALAPGAKLKIAASCFSMYAYEALKAELGQVEELRFIFTSPTFVADEVTDQVKRERREFHIPKLNRERSLYGSEFEIQLRNKLTGRSSPSSEHRTSTSHDSRPSLATSSPRLGGTGASPPKASRRPSSASMRQSKTWRRPRTRSTSQRTICGWRTTRPRI